MWQIKQYSENVSPNYSQKVKKKILSALAVLTGFRDSECVQWRKIYAHIFFFPIIVFTVSIFPFIFFFIFSSLTHTKSIWLRPPHTSKLLHYYALYSMVFEAPGWGLRKTLWERLNDILERWTMCNTVIYHEDVHCTYTLPFKSAKECKIHQSKSHPWLMVSKKCWRALHYIPHV